MRLKTVRISAGFSTAKAMADALGMEEAETYRRWERAETEPSVSHLHKIAELTGASLDFLIGGLPNRNADQSVARRPLRAAR